MPKIAIGTQRKADREFPAPHMPPVPMPPLPATPMPSLPPNPPRPWTAAPAPSASVVQHAYLARREEGLLARAPKDEKKAMAVLRSELGKLPGWRPFGYIAAKDLKTAYDHINRALQAADLTINIEAGSWFAKENPFHSYAQMSQRAVGAMGSWS